MLGAGFLLSQKRSAETLAIDTLTFIMLDISRRISVSTAYNFSCLGTLIACKPAVPTGKPIVMVGHKISWSASFARRALSRHLVVFNFVQIVNTLLFFLCLLLGFWCRCR